MKRIISFLVFLLLGAWLFFWTINSVGWQNIVSAFAIFNCWHGLIIVFLVFLTLVIGCWKWQVILRHQGYNLSLRQLMGSYFTCFSLIYLFPMVIAGGEVFRGFFLKEKHGVPWDKAISSIIIDKILEATSYLVAILTGLIIFLFKIGIPPRNQSLICASIVIFIAAGIGFFYYIAFKRKSTAKYLARFLRSKNLPDGDIVNIEQETFQFFKLKKKVLLEVLGISLLRVVATGLRCWFLILFLGKTIGLTSSLAILGFYYVGALVPIPASLGSYEITQVFAFDALGLGASLAPAFTLIQRGAELLMAFLGLAVFLKLGPELLQSSLIKKIEKLFNRSYNKVR